MGSIWIGQLLTFCFRLSTFCLLLSLLSFGVFGPARGVAAARTSASGCHAETKTAAGRSTSARSCTGALGGVKYVIEVPTGWNGTVVLFSHGTSAPGGDNPAADAPDGLTGAWLLTRGYALAGSAFGTTGWAVKAALRDQLVLLNYFSSTFGRPRTTIAWGDSQGGLIAAGLLQRYPHRFSGALPMCGAVAGSVGSFNGGLDAAFVFKTLIAPDSPLQLVHIKNPIADFLLGQTLLYAAQQTAEGRARIALAAAMYDIPGWYDPASPEPSARDVAARETNQFKWEQEDWGLAFVVRADMESKAGGNPSWNTGIDYGRQLAASVDYSGVQALYKQAGLSLRSDLKRLAAARRFKADPRALQYLSRNLIFDGRIGAPVLTLHTTGDGEVPVEEEQAYAQVVGAAGNGRLLRQLFVHRAGHCAFTPAERLVAFGTLMQRVESESWDAPGGPAALNSAARDMGARFNNLAPAFVSYRPPVFLRPYDRESPPPPP